MSLGGGSGNSEGEGEGGSSTFGPRGQAKDIYGLQRFAHCHPSTDAPKIPIEQGEKFLGSIFEEAGVWAIGEGDIVSFWFLVLSFVRVPFCLGIGMVFGYVCVCWAERLALYSQDMTGTVVP